MTHSKPDTPSPEGKRPFTTPTLTVYGDLAKLAAAKGGNKADGGGPKPDTRSTGNQG